MFNKIDSKQLFLVDSLGALLSAVMLGVVLVRFEPYFGMPSDVLYMLSLMASVFCIYSFTCYVSHIKNRSPFLKVIAVANLMYGCISLILMIYYFSKLTLLGITYFVIEKIIVLFLAVWECTTSIKSL